MRRISAPARLLVLVILVASIATLPAVTAASTLALGGLALGVLLLTRPRLRWLAARLAVALLGVTALALPFLLAGDGARALAVGVRDFFAALTALGCAQSIGLAELPAALRALGAPATLASTVHALIWQLENVTAEGRRLVLARRLRGATAGIGPEVLSLLFLRTALRAERVDLALRLRGASGPRASLRARMRLSDVPALGLALAMACALHFVG